jgi:uncharacterized membrane protein (UPF0127 family)
MRFPLDVIFVDKDGRVIKLIRRIGAWRFALCRGAADAIELAAGALDGVDVKEGDLLTFEPAEAAPSVEAA